MTGRYAPGSVPWNKGIERTAEEKRKISQTKLAKTGGRTITSGGYICIYMPKHPCCTKAGYVMEHRLIMEKDLGRILTNAEDVHHKNGLKKDNRLENLELTTHDEHARLTHSKDLSSRICTRCATTKTIMQRNGRPHWFYLESKLVCNKCYMKDYWARKGSAARKAKRLALLNYEKPAPRD